MGRMDEVLEFLRKETANYPDLSGLSAEHVANSLGYSRCNVSGDLNRLCEQKKIDKIKGKPVLYRIKTPDKSGEFSPADKTRMLRSGDGTSTNNFLRQHAGKDIFDQVIGHDGSLKIEIEKAKAAVMYPPSGLTTMILGPTGVGKTMFANLMYQYALKMGVLRPKANFVIFNCADYAANPQLITAQLFGYNKGAFTGADKDREGLVEKANHGVLFLDEVHRLPPEAQEMLFYLMDFGAYRRLGEVDNSRKSDVFIIVATTEDPDSALLKTFKRRIPVIVKLPSLAERGLVERLNIIVELLRMEAVQLNFPVYINSNAVKAFLVYECAGNIGQLKSDLKLVCARAYMNYITGRRDEITVTLEELPVSVKEGLVNTRNRLNDANIINCDLEVYPEISKGFHLEALNSYNVYDVIERKYGDYLRLNYGPSDIETCLTKDIENFYDSLISNYRMNKKFRQEELLKIVSDETIAILERVMVLLEKETGIKVGLDYCGAFALHINSAIERIGSGKVIVNPNLQHIKAEYPEKFRLAKDILRIMTDVSGLFFPDDEAGFIVKLIESIVLRNGDIDRVGVLVAAHGNGSAKSMAEVANRLLGRQMVKWYDMDLDEPPESSLEAVMKMIVQMDMKKGVLFLVDMGSLLNFGEIISSRTGIHVKSVCMVSTPMVIEAAHLANDPDMSLDQIYSRLMATHGLPMVNHPLKIKNGYAAKVLLTVCITGQGTALKLKEILEKKFDFHSFIEIQPLDYSSIEEFERNIVDIRKEKEVVAIVGINTMQNFGIPFISIDDLMFGKGFKRLENILVKFGVITREENIDKEFDKLLPGADRKVELKVLSEALKNYLNYLDSDKLLPHVAGTMERLTGELDIKLDRSRFVTLFIHICCMTERLIFEVNSFKNQDPGEAASNSTTYSKLKEVFSGLEKAYNMEVPWDEIRFISDFIKA